MNAAPGHHLLVAVLFLAGALPLPAAEKSENAGKTAVSPAKKDAPKDGKKDEKKDAAKGAPKAGAGTNEKAKVGDKPGAKAESAPAANLPPPTDNLVIPADLDEKGRKSLGEAIELYEEAMKAGKGKGAAITKAIAKLKFVSATLPRTPLPSYYLGIIYQLNRNYPEAKRVLEKAVKLNPRFHEAYLELGDVYVWQRDHKGSLAIYDKSLAIFPAYPPACLNKAKALIRLGQYQDAKPYLDQMEKLNPPKDAKGKKGKDKAKEEDDGDDPDDGPDEQKEEPKEDKAGEKAEDKAKLFAAMEQRYLSKRLADQIKGPGWSTTYTAETKFYQVVTPVSQEFANEIAQRAELIHKAYDKVFPPLEKPKRKFPIWVYGDQITYMKAGSPPGTGGYYDPYFRKLVLFRMPRKETTISVLQHEALHQYLDDYLSEAPQWFNEGMGDYFAGFEYVKNGRDERMVPKAFRERLPATRAVASSEQYCVPSSELMQMTHAEFYEGRMIGFHYAQAWGMIYYIGETEKYKPVLLSYFKALQKGADLNEAYTSTFGKLDMARFDQEWKAFIKGLK